MGRAGCFRRALYTVFSCVCFQLALVFVVVAVDAQEFPIAAIQGIIVVIVIAVVNR